MTIEIFKDYQEVSSAVARVILSFVQKQPTAVLCLAAGDTPRLAYSLMAEHAQSGKVDFSQCTFIGLDEWIGIPPDNRGSCSWFLKENLFIPLGIASHQYHLFDALSDDLSEECRKMDSIILDRGGIDLMVVGVGMNGHIGFNEPGISPDSYTHIVPLDATTQSVGQKYFNEPTTLQHGITLGLRHLLESGTAIMVASGSKKAGVITSALEGPVTEKMPASIIRKHPRGLVMLDKEAAAELGG